MQKLKVFSHLLYECKKGVRSAVLCTLSDDCIDLAIAKLDSNEISYFVSPVSNGKSNLFFGEKICIDVLSKICNKPLNKLSAEEDFMLGAILGYSVCEQCRRYTKMSKSRYSPRSQSHGTELCLS